MMGDNGSLHALQSPHAAHAYNLEATVAACMPALVPAVCRQLQPTGLVSTSICSVHGGSVLSWKAIYCAVLKAASLTGAYVLMQAAAVW